MLALSHILASVCSVLHDFVRIALALQRQLALAAAADPGYVEANGGVPSTKPDAAIALSVLFCSAIDDAVCAYLLS